MRPVDVVTAVFFIVHNDVGFQKFVPVKVYALRRGVSRQAVYQMINSGRLISVVVWDMTFVAVD